jgi:hypothetical protein
MTFPQLNLLGGLAGIVLCCLPSLLLLRRERGLTEQEWCAQSPHRTWVVKAVPGSLLLMFLGFMPVVMTTDMGKQLNGFSLSCVFVLWMCAPLIVLEVGMQTSLALGSGSSCSQAPYVQGPNARRAGILRLALTAVVLALFFSYR